MRCCSESMGAMAGDSAHAALKGRLSQQLSGWAQATSTEATVARTTTGAMRW